MICVQCLLNHVVHFVQEASCPVFRAADLPRDDAVPTADRRTRDASILVR